ncbi:sodium:proton antiporter [Macrococcus hajekii]|uniref:Sodium:proton antiporter n=1 Tax=Macrococcus hajekii TaxID=198482 RepID=A0A4R6BJ64_9STAP|nr:sodium:proton antiporter [Macrococcus hajekii]TDM01596.1 sodium:proton antiporter [Macrococcus hajekii]GGB01332.1 sodium:proton antiporter [Macrococcus hajekii]
MNFEIPLTLMVSLILALAIFSQWLASILKWPAIVLMAIAGLLIGPLLGLFNPQEIMGDDVYRTIVSFSVAIILFEGSSNLDIRELRSISIATKRILLISSIIGLVLGTVALHYIVDLPWAIALVLGSLFIVTGPTVIQPLLKQAKVKSTVDSILRWESIILDPIGPIIALLFFYIYQSFNVKSLLAFGAGIGFAAVLGVIAGLLFKEMIYKDKISQELMAPIQFVFIFLIFALSNTVLHESGLLAVTIFGLMMARAKREHLIFHESNHFIDQLALICVSTVFVLITASLTTDMLRSILSWQVLLFVILMIFIIRPLAIFISTVNTEISFKEKALVSFVAPRGIVALTVAEFFASKFQQTDLAMIDMILPITFAFSFISVVIYGFSFSPFSKRLDLSSTEPEGVILIGDNQFSVTLAKQIKSHGIPVMIADVLSSGPVKPEDGIERYRGNILSEKDRLHADLIRFNKCLIITPSLTFNMMAFDILAEEFGLKSVYMLQSDSEKANEQLNTYMHAHILFGDKGLRDLNKLVSNQNIDEIEASAYNQLSDDTLVLYYIDANNEISFKSKTHDLNLNDEGIIGVIKQ